MLFREPSLTSLRRDSTRIQNGWFVTGSSPPCFLPFLSLFLSLSLFASRNVDLCLTLPLPMDLHPDIYYSQYYRARLYCVSRNAFTSKTPAIQPLSFCSFLFLPIRSLRGLSRSMRSSGPYISSIILTRIFIERQNHASKEMYKVNISCKFFPYWD